MWSIGSKSEDTSYLKLYGSARGPTSLREYLHVPAVREHVPGRLNFRA